MREEVTFFRATGKRVKLPAVPDRNHTIMDVVAELEGLGVHVALDFYQFFTLCGQARSELILTEMETDPKEAVCFGRAMDDLGLSSHLGHKFVLPGSVILDHVRMLLTEPIVETHLWFRGDGALAAMVQLKPHPSLPGPWLSAFQMEDNSLLPRGAKCYMSE